MPLLWNYVSAWNASGHTFMFNHKINQCTCKKHNFLQSFGVECFPWLLIFYLLFLRWPINLKVVEFLGSEFFNVMLTVLQHFLCLLLWNSQELEFYSSCPPSSQIWKLTTNCSASFLHSVHRSSWYLLPCMINEFWGLLNVEFLPQFFHWSNVICIGLLDYIFHNWL